MRETELYGIKPTKGALKTGHRLITFDAVQPCLIERCPIHEDCPYVKAGQCSVIRKYLAAITEALIDDIGERMTQPLLNKISLQLMPLFHQLIRFQMFAYTVVDPIYTTARGQIKAHPVFEEIRKCIRAIESTQRSMGMDLEFTTAMEDTMGKLKGMKRANADSGDPDYYDRWKRMNDSSVFPEGKATHPKRRLRKTA